MHAIGIIGSADGPTSIFVGTSIGLSLLIAGAVLVVGAIIVVVIALNKK